MKEMIDFNFDLSKQFFDKRKKFGFSKFIFWSNQAYDNFYYINISKSFLYFEFFSDLSRGI